MPTTPRPSAPTLGPALEAAWAEHAAEATEGSMSGACDADVLWALLFTSGTSAAPKAVRCTQRRLLTTGNRMSMMLELGPDDVGYAAMPLFHTNSLMSGLAAALVGGASLSLARRFSASRFLGDVRHYGVTWFNYTGKLLTYLLATPARADDADNTLRVAFGNEGSPHVVEEAARRFGMRIIDVFGSTEGAIALDRTGNRPSGSIGRLRQGIMVVDEEGVEAPRAVFDAGGRLVNADRCVGEIVNTLGVGPFEGYYRNEEAMRATTRNGWYWSGDLGYVDDDGWVYFAGRTSDWLRVDGENFPAAPIEAIVGRHPDVLLASVYGVPDADSGDQVMLALVLREGADFDAAGVRVLARRPGRPRPEMAAEIPPPLRGASEHAYQQDSHAHAGPREVPLRPCPRRPGVSAHPGRRVVSSFHGGRRGRPARRIRGERALACLGPVAL